METQARPVRSLTRSQAFEPLMRLADTLSEPDRSLFLEELRRFLRRPFV